MQIPRGAAEVGNLPALRAYDNANVDRVHDCVQQLALAREFVLDSFTVGDILDEERRRSVS
ncbi:hypothetical protein, partial [Massilia phosphatilytica]